MTAKKPDKTNPTPDSAFLPFAEIVQRSFQNVAKQPEVFVAAVEPDALWAAYLAAFPEGTNPVAKKKTEHDCSTCRQFVRRVGAAVAVVGGEVVTVWDQAAQEVAYPFGIVATALRDLIRAAPLQDLFRVGTKEASFGCRSNHYLPPAEPGAPDPKLVTHYHFHTGQIPERLRVAAPDSERGEYRTTVQVFERGLAELTSEAVETVVGLIGANNLYRGEEHRRAVLEFQQAQVAYGKLGERGRRLFAWANARGPAARFRNTVVGTLVQDLSAGVEVDAAVRSFETKVAPQNYKRTTAVITPGMVKKAMEAVAALGLEPALERRLAVMSDISVADVLWVDGSAKPLMKGGIGDVLLQHAAATAAPKGGDDEKQAEPVSLEDFVTKVLPTATSVEVLFQPQHVGNLVSLTAPVHQEPKQLFRWSNDFAWSYNGNVADSYLRKQVQSLGGRVDGVLRFSHMWNHDKRNTSLMDLHVFMPGSSPHPDGQHDNYPSGQRVGWNCRKDLRSGGVQDVDYTSPAPEGYVPVENITFPSLAKLRDGQYTFKIHNWQLREPTQGGFRAEVEFGGQVFQYDHPAPLRHKEWVTLAVATLRDGAFTIEHRHPVGTPSQTVWGLRTGQYVRVNAVTLSPNFWGGQEVGNKHTILVLDGAKCDEPTRGIYNEFLHLRLEPHRKVFEVIGDKTKCPPVDGAVSGLGFSSTKRDSFVARVLQGKRRRLLRVSV